jgi:hypothetical protein
VADYSQQIADGLQRAGINIEVCCPTNAAVAATNESRPSTQLPIVINRIPGLRSPIGWLTLGRRIDRRSERRVLLVQYVPHGWGCRAMNVGFCLWLLWRRLIRGDDVRVMFHEVAMPFVVYPIRHNLQAVVNRLMAAIVLASSRHVYVSTPAFGRMLTRLSLGWCSPVWLPVPSNVPRITDAAAVAAVRNAATGGDAAACVVGHFGTFGGQAGDLLRDTLKMLLLDGDQVRVLLLGEGALAFCSTLAKVLDPGDISRIHPRENLDPAALSAHVQACDIMLQPYPDGVTTRRSTAMAALVNGVPLVTNLGRLSEALWMDNSIAATAAAPSAALLVQIAQKVIQDKSLGSRLRSAGSTYYEENFAIGCTIRTIQNSSYPEGSACRV